MKKLLLTFLLFLGMTSLIGCGPQPQNSIIKDLNLQTDIVNNDVQLTMEALFQFGPMSMTAINIPIVNPNNSEQIYGKFFIKPTLQNNYNDIGVMLNLSQIANIPGGIPSLPNGEDLPIGGLNTLERHIVQLEINSINARIYIGLDAKLVMLGFAISIKEFDVLKQYIGGSNIFLGFNIKGVLGSVGVYSGKDPNQSGLGFFVDLSSVISPDMLNKLIEGHKWPTPTSSTSSVLAHSQSKSVGHEWNKSYGELVKENFGPDKLDAKDSKKLQKAFKAMDKNGNILHYVEE